MRMEGRSDPNNVSGARSGVAPQLDKHLAFGEEAEDYFNDDAWMTIVLEVDQQRQ
jgi:hypothetical protein